MNLRIGNTTVAITSCTRMRDLKRGFYLDIKIPKDSISMDELSALLDGNTETIYVIDGENESAYNGFKMLSTLSLENGVYQVCQACTSEIEAQLSVAQNKVAEQAKELEATKQVVNRQSETINAQGKTIATQQKAIDDQASVLAEQGETVMGLEDASAMQSATIESMLLEAIPFIVETAVYTAVENALSSILPPAGEESTDVPEEVTGDIVEEPVDEE